MLVFVCVSVCAECTQFSKSLNQYEVTALDSTHTHTHTSWWHGYVALFGRRAGGQAQGGRFVVQSGQRPIPKTEVQKKNKRKSTKSMYVCVCVCAGSVYEGMAYLYTQYDIY